MSKNSILSLVEKLYPFHYKVIGPGNDAAIPKYLEELDFRIHEYGEQEELNGWTVPRSEVLTKAEIRKDGKLIYDGLASPLGTILMCAPFKGRVSLQELQAHLHYHDKNPEAIPFHCTQQYRPGKNDWGFCMPKTLFDRLKDGSYDVEIVVERRPSTMKVLDFTLPGKSAETIVFQAHNCHPFQANDDISGCAVGIRLMQELQRQKNRYYTYRLLISPELTGTLFWLHRAIQNPADIKAAVILAAVGNDAALRLQDSFTGQAQIDRIAHRVYKQRFGVYDSGAFRTVYGNDETVFEAPGFAIPTISVTRYPFATYHSDGDTPETLSEVAMDETLDVLRDIVDQCEQSEILIFIGEGLYCLSHPKFDLYQRVWDPSDRTGPKSREEGRAWNRLMTDLPRRLDGQTSIRDLAEMYNLPYEEVRRYCLKWVERGLAKFKKEAA